MMESPDVWGAVGLSAQVATAAVLLDLVPALAVAYWLARTRRRGAVLVENLVQLPLVLPPVVTGYVLLLAFAPGAPLGQFMTTLGWPVAFTTTGAALAAAVVAFPFVVQTMRVTFETLDPTWREAAAVDGATSWQAFRWVTLPLAGRGLAGACVLGFGRALGEFGATIVLAGNLPGTSRTLPLAMFTELQRVGGERTALVLAGVAVALSFASLLVHAALTRRLHRANTAG